jgi:hypothetical protein
MQETKVKIIDALFLAEGNSAKNLPLNRARSADARFFFARNKRYGIASGAGF